MTASGLTPEQRARQQIDAALAAAGWLVQDRDEVNLAAGRGVAVREFPLERGHGFADYLLFVDGKPCGVLEAKPEGFALTGVEPQARRYADGLPASLRPPVRPLPFLYLSTGAVTRFTNLLDPHPRSRELFAVHRPETLAEWLTADTLDAWVKSNGAFTAAEDTKPSSLRSRLRAMPHLHPGRLYENQRRAITNLERSVRDDRPSSLIQMATGFGKTIMAVASIQRLTKFIGARRVLFGCRSGQRETRQCNVTSIGSSSSDYLWPASARWTSQSGGTQRGSSALSALPLFGVDSRARTASLRRAPSSPLLLTAAPRSSIPRAVSHFGGYPRTSRKALTPAGSTGLTTRASGPDSLRIWSRFRATI